MNFFSDYSRYGERLVAVDSNGGELSYGKLSEFCGELSKAIKPRSLVLQFCENSLGSLMGYLGFLNCGVVPLMIDKRTDSELVDRFIKIYQPRYLYLPKDQLDSFSEMETVLENRGYVLLSTGFEETKLHDDLGLLLTTSGSVGSPKLVRQSYRNLQSNAEAIVNYLELDENERPITTLPMNYTYGLSVINSHVLVGATLLITEATVVSKPFWDFFKAKEATSIAGVPFTYEMLKKIRFFRMDLPSLKTMTQAGGKLSPDLHGEFAEYASEKGKRFVVMYGQTEATARMGYLPAEKAIEKKGSMGIAIPGGKLVLIASDGSEITESGVVGELVYEGENVTLGYAQEREDLAKGDERGGRLETGDMAKFDDDGYFYVVGRKKRFLKLYGNRVNLDEIDRLVKGHFGFDCASVGTDECLTAYITEKDREKEVVLFLSEKTHINSNAFKVIYIEDIPKNESGKVLYSKL